MSFNLASTSPSTRQLNSGVMRPNRYEHRSIYCKDFANHYIGVILAPAEASKNNPYL